MRQWTSFLLVLPRVVSRSSHLTHLLSHSHQVTRQTRTLTVDRTHARTSLLGVELHVTRLSGTFPVALRPPVCRPLTLSLVVYSARHGCHPTEHRADRHTAPTTVSSAARRATTRVGAGRWICVVLGSSRRSPTPSTGRSTATPCPGLPTTFTSITRSASPLASPLAVCRHMYPRIPCRKFRPRALTLCSTWAISGPPVDHGSPTVCVCWFSV